MMFVILAYLIFSVLIDLRLYVKSTIARCHHKVATFENLRPRAVGAITCMYNA